jgi:AraC-like DNA-binding protein
MQRVFENTQRTWRASLVTGRAVITFRTQPGQSLHWSGMELEPSNIVRNAEGQESFAHASSPASMGFLSLPLSDMVSVGAAMAGLDLMPPKDPLILAPPLSAIARLQRLHEAAGNLAEDVPAVLASPEAARGLEQALIEAMIVCLGGGAAREDKSALRRPAAIMRRFHQVVEDHLEEPLYIPELCTEVGTTWPTLNKCCNEHLGMGPKHYLLIRRMHMVRRALLDAKPADMRVTEIATRYGFWEFGRLAVEYKALFGESPSATLARPA